MSSLVLDKYVVDKLKIILPYDFETKDEVEKLLKIELAKIKIFDIEELTFYELITAVCISKGILEKEVLDHDFTKKLKIFLNFQSIYHKTEYLTQNSISLINKKYLFDELERKINLKYDTNLLINGNKIIFKNGNSNVFVLFNPFFSEQRICFSKIHFPNINSEEEYFSIFPEDFLITKNPKYIKSSSSNKKGVAECKFVLLDELMWIVDNINFKILKKENGRFRGVVE